MAIWKDEHDVLGVEPSEEARAFAQKRLDGRVEAGTLPDGINAEPESWDFVLMTDVLEHVENADFYYGIIIVLLTSLLIFQSRAFSRLMLAGAMDVNLDKQGRVIMPDYLKQFAVL